MLLLPSSKEVRIKKKVAIEYIKPFETYGQAFDYYGKKGIDKDIAEVYLTLGLSVEDTIMRKDYLNKYLSHKNAKYKEYAQTLLSNRLDIELSKNTRQVVFCSSSDFFLIKNGGVIAQYEKSEQESKKLLYSLSSNLKKNFPQKEVISVDSVVQIDFANTQKIYTCANATLYADPSGYKRVETQSLYYSKSQQGIDVFKLSPEYWMFFKENNLSSIEFFYAMSSLNRSRMGKKILGATLWSIVLFPAAYFIWEDVFNKYNTRFLYYSFDIKSKQKKKRLVEDYKRKLTPRAYQKYYLSLAGLKELSFIDIFFGR